jgi:predicted Zn finger-like uncharacterized protein
MSTVRLRRLKADSARLQEYVRRHPRVRLVQMEGDPPERYQLEYRVNSLRMVNGELQPVQSHLVEVTLPRNYPRTPPQCRMLSPVFHPNIAPHAICVGDHWGAGEALESIIIRIGEMLAYQSYHVKSPLNGEAARGGEENKHRVPLDRVSMLPEEEGGGAQAVAGLSEAGPREESARVAGRPERQSAAGTLPGSEASAAVLPGSQTPATGLPGAQVQVNCPHCATGYRVSPNLVGRTVRCKKCDTQFVCATGG